jgi:WD40 repeat protein
MVLNAPATVSEFTSVTGKVLAVSPDGNTVIVSDTLATPNQVFIFTSSGTSHSSVALNITGATAADFSPDNLKAYIVAGSTLYVYSTLEALQTVPLTAPATDAAFLANGMFGYMAGGDPAGVSFLPTCNAPPLVASLGSVPVSGTTLLRALPDGVTMLALSPPDIQTFTASISGTLAIGENGCPAPRGGLTVANPTNPQGPFPLGAGDFVATQLLVAPDGSTAYVISGSVPKVIIFNISGHTSSSIALTGGATPIRATLTPDGTLLYVAANDGQVHLLSTVANSDILQISFPPGTTSQPTGLCSGVTFTCVPDLIAVKP